MNEEATDEDSEGDSEHGDMGGEREGERRRVADATVETAGDDEAEERSTEVGECMYEVEETRTVFVAVSCFAYGCVIVTDVCRPTGALRGASPPTVRRISGV